MRNSRAPAQQRPVDPLHSYKAKRDFAHTPEPQQQEGVAANGHGPLTFVVQKHWASSLHYDFRLELDGQMKSWAVPKGPSLDPTVKRMAVQVEDHPIAYAAFEGIIPARQYGAGKVIIWDAGSWTPLNDPLQAYRDGNLKFELQGHKLCGKWVLVRMKGKGEKQIPWLLIKEKDACARASADYSVVDALPGSVNGLGLPRAAVALPKSPDAMASMGVAAALPDQLSPQLATLAARPPPPADDWLCEIKFDGYRMLVRVEHGKARLFTRNGRDWTAKLRPLQKVIDGLKWPPGWFDGEIVVPNEAGIPDFGALQQAFDTGNTDEVVLYLFDLPYFDGHDLRALPLERRRAVLKDLLLSAPSERVRFSEAFDAAPDEIVASACKLGLEGIIAKRRSSRYQSSRSVDWIKLKCGLRQEFVIGGYTDPQGTRTGFGSLLLGVHDAQGVLQYAGNVGSGFDQRTLTELTRTLSAQGRTKSPFAARAEIKGKPRWVAPTLVVEVSFGAWTRAAHIRHAVFRGLRTDKDARAIVREKALHVNTARLVSTPGRTPAHKMSRYPQITNPQRVIDARTGTTKLDLVRYYDVVGKLMMQHLKGRPVSLVRAPDGVDGQLFFQKHAETGKLPGIRQIGPLDPALTNSHPALLEVVSAQGLLSAAQWNVVEFHTLNTSSAWFEHPDRMVFDLDPGESVPWAHMQEAAQLVRAFLAQLGLPSFLKTSGGKGLHVVVPVRRLHDWDTVKGFSQAIVLHMARTIPQRFVAKSGPKNRAGKIFIDYLRNGLGATTVCAWSARARPGLGISVPVAWSELPLLRGGDHWTVKTVHERLDTCNEPWNAYAKAARSLTAAMATLGYNLAASGSSAATRARTSKPAS
ncbi:MAG: DNA ligase D [Rhodoferax sp.]|nr:DNA ligase D [Rhodoferax sp.]